MNMHSPAHAGTPALCERMRRVAKIAAVHADDVDARARFPEEAVEALRTERLLGAQIPAELGGDGATIAEIAELCAILGQACSAAAMVFAMHQIKAFEPCQPWRGRALAPRPSWRAWPASSCCLPRRPPKAASAATCATRSARSRSPATPAGWRRTRPSISYGDMADAILITSRAPCRCGRQRPGADGLPERPVHAGKKPTSGTRWGMRGTCSDGFLFKGEAPAEQILPRPFAEIAAQSMLAYSHILWSAVWYGIAADAFARAQAFVARRRKAQPRPDPRRAPCASPRPPACCRGSRPASSPRWKNTPSPRATRTSCRR